MIFELTTEAGEANEGLLPLIGGGRLGGGPRVGGVVVGRGGGGCLAGGGGGADRCEPFWVVC